MPSPPLSCSGEGGDRHWRHIFIRKKPPLHFVANHNSVIMSLCLFDCSLIGGSHVFAFLILEVCVPFCGAGNDGNDLGHPGSLPFPQLPFVFQSPPSRLPSLLSHNERPSSLGEFLKISLQILI